MVKNTSGDHLISVLRTIYPHVEHARFGFDKNNSTLIVLSLEQYAEQIAQIISRLDTPAQATDRGTGNDSENVIAEDMLPVMREYPVKHVDGDHVVAILSSLYPTVVEPNAYARFAFDSRRNVVVVIISEHHHANVKKLTSLVDTPMEKASKSEIDLLGLVNPDVHAVSGDWKISDGVLLADDAPAARISFPYSPPEEYYFYRRIYGNPAVSLRGAASFSR